MSLEDLELEVSEISSILDAVSGIDIVKFARAVVYRAVMNNDADEIAEDVLDACIKFIEGIVIDVTLLNTVLKGHTNIALSEDGELAFSLTDTGTEYADKIV